MRTLSVKVPYHSRQDVFHFYHLTDTHIGAKACDEKLLKRDIETIANDPLALWGHGGDVIEAICQVGDRRYKPATLAKWALGINDVMGAQVDYALELFKPIADKCLYLVSGNHEWAADTFYARNVYWEWVKGMAAAAGKKPEELALGAQGFVRMSFRRHTGDTSGSGWGLTLYSHHGYGGGRLPGGHALALGRVLGDYECDLAFMGHRHVRMILDKVVTAPTSRFVRHKLRVAAFVPSYLNTLITPGSERQPIDTYPELMGLPPTHVGTIPTLIYPNEKRFELVYASGMSQEHPAA